MKRFINYCKANIFVIPIVVFTPLTSIYMFLFTDLHTNGNLIVACFMLLIFLVTIGGILKNLKDRPNNWND